MKFRSVAVFVALLLFSVESRAQTTAFTYQGQLSSNNVAANGLYDLRFQLFDVSSNAVFSPITNSPTGVTNGQFIVTLDFGATVFDGSDRWLQIAVRNYGSASDYTPLSPLQPITSVPYAVRSIVAQSATNAMNLTSPLQGTNIVGIVPVANLPTNVAFLSSNQTFTGANTFSGAVTANNSANVFSGDGAGLKNLAATNLTGILPDARLSANVALQSNAIINFAGSVGASNFVGAGHGLTNVPGAFFWVIPTNGLMYPNVGYICTNDFSPVTMTLPGTNAASIGDTYKMVGGGGAGWIIAQTNGETIFSGNLSSSAGQSWKTNGISGNWSAITCSSDGAKLVAVIGDTSGNTGQIYTNDNSGTGTWTAKESSRQWVAVASSSDGTKLIAANYGSSGSGSPGVYLSTDSGGTWTRRLTVSSCTSVASSADGSKLVAVVNGGSIYTNSGTTFTAVGGSTSGLLWKSVASSADGTKLVAVEGNGAIYTSSNSGLTWLSRINVGSGAGLDAVACSSDGSRLIAGANGGTIYVSTDSGVTWVQENPTALSGQLAGIASSSDGSRLFVVSSGSGNIFASFDSGLTWSLLNAAPAGSWSGITCSADGSLLAATTYGGKIYISSQSSTTAGPTGYLFGAQHSAIELIYTGNGNFLPLNHEGTIRAY